jgi:hypothetical protein
LKVGKNIPQTVAASMCSPEFDDQYQTSVEKQKEWASKIQGTSIMIINLNTACIYLHAVLQPL